MLAQVYINRHVVAANKKATKTQNQVIDLPAISINTYLGVIYAKEIEFTAKCKLIQNAENARCSGATIWIEAEFESLIIDGVKANKSMFSKQVYQVRETIIGTTAEEEGKLIKEFPSFIEASSWLDKIMPKGETRNLYVCSRLKEKLKKMN